MHQACELAEARLLVHTSSNRTHHSKSNYTGTGNVNSLSSKGEATFSNQHLLPKLRQNADQTPYSNLPCRPGNSHLLSMAMHTPAREWQSMSMKAF